MKKLYLLATLALVAFAGNAGNGVDSVGPKKTLPAQTEMYSAFKTENHTATKLETEKKTEAQQIGSQHRAVFQNLVSSSQVDLSLVAAPKSANALGEQLYMKADPLSKLYPVDFSTPQTTCPPSGAGPYRRA